jgi:hypothetical protein
VPDTMQEKTWVMIVGALFGALTLVFLMALVAGSIFDFQVPCNGRFLVFSVISLGAALSAAFIGGHAVANGEIGMPGGAKPLVIGVGGGIAVLVIMFVLLQTLYDPGTCSVAVS